MKATLITTNLSQGRIWEAETVETGPIGWPNATHQVSVYPDMKRQVFHGFGGAFTESSAYNWRKLPQDKQKAFMERYFGEEGLRYSQGRVHIGSCDFALGNYACVTGPEDQSFDTSRDEKYLLPMVKAAEEAAGQKLELLLSPWSPPAFMKDNGNMNDGGKLLPEYARMWASCMAEYARFYREQGCDVRRVSVQNEPAARQTWDSCEYTGREEGEFAADHLRPALDAAGLQDVAILAWDHNKDVFPYRAQDTMSAEGAREAIAGFGLHWYTGDHFDSLRLVGETWPEQELWFTEGCVEYNRFGGRTAQQKAEMYAHDILGNLNAGVCGFIDWNLLLDAQGGPNHKGNFCEAPIMLTGDEQDFTCMTEYYYIGQFSRYLQTGARRMGTSTWCSQAEAVAFENPDGSRVLIALNRGDDELPLYITQDGDTGWYVPMAPHTIATLIW